MTQIPEKYQVPGGLHFQSKMVARTRGLWKALGNLETGILRDELEDVAVSKPIYVTGLARSGTTIVTEMLSQHPAVTSHRYSDFPFTYIPYWRNYLRDRSQKAKPEAKERAHKDRIMVTNDSPEAVEEVLWMHFFQNLHNPAVDNVLTEQHRQAKFDKFYQEHIRKLLKVRNASRYLAKGNYNISRLRYIHSLFPDARFVIPVRNPINHIASLHKQHQFFVEGQTINPKMRVQLGLSGHFEFGLDRTAIHVGDETLAKNIANAWENGEDAKGWALYWAGLYQFVLDQLDQHESLKNACQIIRYEALCKDSADVIDAITNHCDLPADGFEDVRSHYIDHLSEPDYYRHGFSDGEVDTIQTITESTAASLGYQP